MPDWARAGGNYDYLLAGPIFKIGSLNLFSTEHMFYYHEILKFQALENRSFNKSISCLVKVESE